MERVKPSNRHMLVVPHVKKNETNSGVLLPDDFESDSPRYIKATVIDVAEDCSSQFKSLRYESISNNDIIIDSSMLQEVKLKDKIHYFILENYVLGLYKNI